MVICEILRRTVRRRWNAQFFPAANAPEAVDYPNDRSWTTLPMQTGFSICNRDRSFVWDVDFSSKIPPLEGIQHCFFVAVFRASTVFLDSVVTGNMRWLLGPWGVTLPIRPYQHPINHSEPYHPPQQRIKATCRIPYTVMPVGCRDIRHFRVHHAGVGVLRMVRNCPFR
jgi:hypothetical protein